MEGGRFAEQQCKSYIYHLRFSNGFVCPSCENTKAYATREGMYKCSQCGYKMSVKVGTDLERSRLTLRQWFLAIQYTSSQLYPGKITISTYQKEVGLGSNRSAAKVKRVISKALNQGPLCKLSGNVEVCVKTVPIAGHTLFLVLAGEVEKRRVLRCRGKLFTERPTDISWFIENCIVSGTRLHFPNGVADIQSIEARGYIWVNHSEGFYARTIDGKSYLFINALRSCNTLTEAQQKTDDICCKMNGAYTPITFEDLLKRIFKIKV